ncbi:MAG: DMT family transporter [Planctomycetota bacterium]
MGEHGLAERDPLRGFLYAAAGCILVSFNYTLGKYGMSRAGGKYVGFNPATFGFLWLSAAAVYLFVLLAAAGRAGEIALPAGARRGTWSVGVLAGIEQVMVWEALARLDPAFSAFLWRFVPALLIVGGVVVLHERLRGFEVAAIVVMLAGGALSVFGRWEVVEAIGVLCVAGSAVVVAAERLVMKVTVRRVRPLVLNFYRASLGALILAAWILLTGAARFDVAPGYWRAVLVGALLGATASQVMIIKSFQYWDLSKSSMVMMTQPLIVLPVSYVALGMHPRPQRLAGGLVILAGGLWLIWMHARSSPAHGRAGPTPEEASDPDRSEHP